MKKLLLRQSAKVVHKLAKVSLDASGKVNELSSKSAEIFVTPFFLKRWNAAEYSLYTVLIAQTMSKIDAFLEKTSGVLEGLEEVLVMYSN